MLKWNVEYVLFIIILLKNNYYFKNIYFQKRFKRLRRLEDEESDDDGTGENPTEDREAIANTLFDMSDNVKYIKIII